VDDPEKNVLGEKASPGPLRTRVMRPSTPTKMREKILIVVRTTADEVPDFEDTRLSAVTSKMAMMAVTCAVQLLLRRRHTLKVHSGTIAAGSEDQA
jgi:hypothetical protein